MKKILFLILTFLMFSSMSSAKDKINLEDYINSFLWKKRIVLFITEAKYIHFVNETDDFFTKNSCENEARNLKYIRIVGDEINRYIMPDKFKNKFGLWLIGYDGGNKSHSTDISLLNQIHNIIDEMPIRKKEKAEQNKRCN